MWDTPGFMQFNEFELAVMNTYVETGIRERQDTLGLVTGTEAGFPGGQALPVDHFVWVFGMNRLGVVAGGGGTGESKHSREEKQPPAVSVTKKQLELTKEGRELFWQFFSCARTRAGSTPSVVLTHVDQVCHTPCIAAIMWLSGCCPCGLCTITHAVRLTVCSLLARRLRRPSAWCKH